MAVLGSTHRHRAMCKGMVLHHWLMKHLYAFVSRARAKLQNHGERERGDKLSSMHWLQHFSHNKGKRCPEFNQADVDLF